MLKLSVNDIVKNNDVYLPRQATLMFDESKLVTTTLVFGDTLNLNEYDKIELRFA